MPGGIDLLKDLSPGWRRTTDKSKQGRYTVGRSCSGIKMVEDHPVTFLGIFNRDDIQKNLFKHSRLNTGLMGRIIGPGVCVERHKLLAESVTVFAVNCKHKPFTRSNKLRIPRCVCTVQRLLIDAKE